MTAPRRATSFFASSPSLQTRYVKSGNSGPINRHLAPCLEDRSPTCMAPTNACSWSIDNLPHLFVSEGTSALFPAHRSQQRSPPHVLLLDLFYSPQHSCSSSKNPRRGNGEEPHKSLRISSRCLLQRNRNPFLKALSSLIIALPASGTPYPKFD